MNSCPKCGSQLTKMHESGLEYCAQTIKVTREGPPYARIAKFETTGCGIVYQMPISEGEWWYQVVPKKYASWENGYQK